MSNPITTTTTGLWRILLFDPSDPADPRWILASVVMPSDVRPADTDDSGHRYTDWPAVTRWVRAQVGRSDVSLVPMDRALCWRVDERR
jgi:hypothetical protein